MITINAHVSKKVPIENRDYSSQNYSAGMECEVSGSAGEEEIKENFRRVYQLLEECIEEQMKADEDYSTLSGRLQGNEGSPEGSYDGNGWKATEAQVKAIHAIARDRGVSDEDLTAHIRDSYGAGRPEELSVVEASDMIDALKAVKAG